MDMTKDNVTDQVCDFIRTYSNTKGYPPSTREIAAGCFISRGAVTRHLDRLEIMGRIHREPGKARGLRVLDAEPDGE